MNKKTFKHQTNSNNMFFKYKRDYLNAVIKKGLTNLEIEKTISEKK